MLAKGIKHAAALMIKQNGSAKEKERSALAFLLFAAATTTTGAFMLSSGVQNPGPNSRNNFYYNNLDFVSPKVPKLNLPLESVPFIRPTTVRCSSSFEEASNLENDESGKNFKPASDQDPSTYIYEKLGPPPRSLAESHAIFDSLSGSELIERYNLYRRVPIDTTPETSSSDVASGPKEVAVADIRIGKKLNGHKGIVHGGIITLLFDDSMGWGYEVLVQQMLENAQDEESRSKIARMIVTANLNIDFRRPLKEGTSVVIRIYHEKTERRKLFFSARMESHDGIILYSEAKALFIMLNNEKK